MMESLESRLLFSRAVDTSSVGLFNPDGTAATLDPSRDTWLVIHGRGASKDDETFQSLAHAVAIQSPDHQVLLVGWGLLAGVPTSAQAERNALATADAVAAMVRAANITGLHVNLIGFSMGGYIEDRLSRDLHKVNRLIAIDPSNGGGFAAHSLYSIAFHGVMSPNISLSAKDAVQITDLPGSSGVRHVETILAFRTMMIRDAGIESAPEDHISPLFSISNILTGQLPSWRKGSFKGFNAKLAVGAVAGSPYEFGPLELAYVDRSRHHVRLF